MNEIIVSQSPTRTLEQLSKEEKKIKEDSEEYYQIRHAFKIYFPEFVKTTYQYVSIASSNTLDAENKNEYEGLIMRFDNYLDSVKSTINASDKMSLKVGIKSLSKILDSEREKVNDYAEKKN